MAERRGVKECRRATISDRPSPGRSQPILAHSADCDIASLMRRLLIALLSLLALAAIVAGWKLLADFQRRAVNPGELGRYKATTRFVINPSGDDDASYSAAQKAAWLHDQLRLISSDDVLLPVVDRLNLHGKWHTSTEEAASRIGRVLRVELEPTESVVSITVWGEETRGIAEIANAVRDSYVDRRKAMGLDGSRRLRQSISAPIMHQLEEVEKARSDLERLQRRYNVVDTGTRQPGASSAEQGLDQDDYQAAKRRCEAAEMLLNSMNEHSMKRAVEERVIGNPIAILEIAGTPRP